MPQKLTHFYNFDLWYDLNELVSKSFGHFGESGSCRLYKGLYSGLFEIAIGLARQFPLKKQLVYVKGLDPYLDLIARQFSRDGYELVTLSVEELASSQQLIEKVSKETLLVLLAADDPFWGKLYDFEEVVESLSGQRTVSLMLSHHRHRVRGFSSTLPKYSIELCHYTKDLAMARMGSRVRFSDSVAAFMEWDPREAQAVASEIEKKVHSLEDMERVIDFEKGLPGGWISLFDPEVGPSQRLFDRSVLFNEKIDATAVIEALCEQHGLKYGSEEQFQSFETSSLSRWGGLKTLDWMTTCGLNPVRRRGCLSISVKLIDKELTKQLSAITKLLS